MDMAKVGAEILLRELGIPGRGVSEVQAAAALRLVLPFSNGQVDVAALITTMTNAGDSTASAMYSWLGKCTNQSVNSGHVIAAFGVQAVGRYAKALGVGVNLAISTLARALPEMIEVFCKDLDPPPVLDLMQAGGYRHGM